MGDDRRWTRALALLTAFVCTLAQAGELNLDVLLAPRSEAEIRRPTYLDDPRLSGGGRGCGLRIEALPDVGQGWTFHGEFVTSDGRGPGKSDLDELRLGIGGQRGGPRFRAGLYAEYSRLALDAGHIDGAGLQVRFNFRASRTFANLQLGHRCLQGTLRFPGQDAESLGFDLAEILASVGYRAGVRLSAVAEVRRSWEVLSPNVVDLDQTTALLTLRLHLRSP